VYQAWTTWRILECRGCGYVFIQTTSANTEDYDQAYDVDGSTITTLNEALEYWPTLSKRKMPDWMENGIEAENVGPLNHSMRKLYGALDNALNRLAAIGTERVNDFDTSGIGI
jgi:hypothetical protein